MLQAEISRGGLSVGEMSLAGDLSVRTGDPLLQRAAKRLRKEGVRVRAGGESGEELYDLYEWVSANEAAAGEVERALQRLGFTVTWKETS